MWDAAPGSADAKSIDTRLGWLDVAHDHDARTSSVLRRSADAARSEGIRAVYLLGMGGSSLCAEVMRSVFGVTPTAAPELFVLDTTDERTITQAAARHRTRSETLFIVASKSGGTVEVASMERFFWQRAVRGARQQGGPAFHRDHRSRAPRSSSSPPLAATATCSSTRPTSADASRRCRCSDSCPRR